MIAQGFASAGGHNHQGIFAFKYIFDDFLLERSEFFVSENIFENSFCLFNHVLVFGYFCKGIAFITVYSQVLMNSVLLIVPLEGRSGTVDSSYQQP